MPRSPATLRPYAWALGICWVLPAIGVAIGYALLPKHNPEGQCEGIGFGCTLPPADGLLLLAFLAAPFLVGLGLVVVVVIAVVQGRRSRNAG